MNKKISDTIVKRLPRYYQMLKALESSGEKRISSSALARHLNVTASQVRQDLSQFGGFGQKGYGYEISYLKGQIARILGLDKPHTMIVIGGGRIGQALASYKGFDSITTTAVFDIEPEKIKLKDTKVLHIDKLSEYTKKNKADICVIATQKEAADGVADLAIKCGIKSILNFAPIMLPPKKGIMIENVILSENLFFLTYKLKTQK